MGPGRPATWRVALLYAALTVALAYPLSIHPADRVLSAGPDTDLFVWTLSWDVHAFTHQPFSIFEANIYYPEHRTLAYSENLIGSAPFAAPIVWLTGNPVLAMNLVALLSCVLCGVGAYLLASRLGVGMCGAALSGLVFAFTPPRFLRLDQFHLATIQWIPFALAALHAYFDGGRKRNLRLAAAFFTLQALSSGHGAVFLTVAVAVVVACRLALRERGDFVGRPGDLGAPGVLWLLPAALVLWPYRVVQQEMGLRRSLEDWAVSWASFLASSTHVDAFLLSLVPSWHINETTGPHLFPGIAPIVLACGAFAWLTGRAGKAGKARRIGRAGWTRALAGVLEVGVLACITLGVYVAVTGITKLSIGGLALLTIRQRWRLWVFIGLAIAMRVVLAPKAPLLIVGWIAEAHRRFRVWRAGHRHDARLPYAIITVLGLWLSVGPPVGLWPLVYWLPGLNFIRAPSRFMLLAVLGLAMLSGMGFERLAARWPSRRRRIAAVCVGALLVAEFAAAPFGLEPYSAEIPAIDRWLAGQPAPMVLAEAPVGSPGNLGQWEQRETTFMLHSMAHWQKTVHGYSGFRSALHETLYAELSEFPDERSLRRLTDLGVTDVVVHTDLYAPGEWIAVGERIARFGDWLTLRHVEGAGRVYALRRPR